MSIYYLDVYSNNGLKNCNTLHSWHLYFMVFLFVRCLSIKLRRDGRIGNVALQFLHLFMS